MLTIARRIARLATAVAIAAIATPAIAQFGGGGFGQGAERTIDSKQLERIAEMLDMDDTQLMVARDFLTGYISEHSAIVEEREMLTQAAREEFRESRDPSVWRSVGQSMQDLGEKADKLEQQFFEDVKLLLNEDQMASWPVVERDHRRTSTIERGLLSGETVDLIAIVENVASTDTAPDLDQTLESYATDLDRALVKRNEIYADGMSRARDLMQSGDFETMNKLFEEGREAGLRVRDINKRYARQIAAMLPEDVRAAFDREVNRESFPQIYRRSYAGRVFSTVDELQSLSDDQRAQINAIRDTYERQAESVNTKWAKAIEEQEANQDLQSMMRGRFGRGGGQGGMPDELREFRDERRDLDAKVAEQIKTLLTEDQAAKLPEEPRFDRRGFGGGDENQRGRRGGRRGGQTNA